MVQRKEVSTICDRCGLPADGVKRRLMHPDRRRQVSFDACERCVATVPLAEWEGMMPRSPRGSTRRVVVSEAVVRQAGKRVRKKAPAVSE